MTRFDGCVGRSNVRRTGRGTTRIETDVSIGEEERKTKQEKQKQAATKEKKTKNGPKYTVVQVIQRVFKEKTLIISILHSHCLFTIYVCVNVPSALMFAMEPP